MKRLLELPATDRLTARAHTLVRAVGSTVESEERLLRVRRALDAPKGRAAPRWALRAALAAALLVASAAAAAATGALAGVFAPAVPTAGPVNRGLPAIGGVKTLAVQPRAMVGDSAVAEPALAAPAPAPQAASPHLAPAAPTSDVARVHEAAKALRHDGDPSRALALLERSGKPISGPLAEEALALRIEASAARGDGRKARLAAAYLAQYPDGHYRDLAKKALASSSP